MSFKVTILGSSGALPAYGRHPSAQLVEIQNRYFLVDCGEAVQMQLMKFQGNYHRIGHILISHLHGDHYLGLMGLLFTMHLQRRTNDLHIHSHRGLDEIITTQFKYSQSVPSFKIIFHTLKNDVREVIYEDDALTVETIPLVHKLRCSGFLFREKPKPRRIDKSVLPEGLLIQQLAGLKRGEDVCDEFGNVLYKNETLTLTPRKSRSYAYCSDTAYNEQMVEQIRGIDLLYHEATFANDEEQKAKETKHSTAAQAATIASLANVHQLLLGHFSARYKDPQPLLEEAIPLFSNTRLAIEGEEHTIPE
ncbi:ribonuclease Z [Pseudochryseolinea flava]|uniref:Ribonuclease Z n=1 Tax=Pseudochryseolinea flava TaxID=2059302 RepID=A0A364XZ10_9BACT|nr:ribonuclease Z [Pseudochryseolinea flava]RAV99538.1 ribonuclease Z [Pseudochryseolinea flava]